MVFIGLAGMTIILMVNVSYKNIVACMVKALVYSINIDLSFSSQYRGI